ncbi:MAG: extracellular solute-binding protein [Chloroflexi bacterium]|nr:extracellular solute-binding protein [Chloroflexota bacterium]
MSRSAIPGHAICRLAALAAAVALLVAACAPAAPAAQPAKPAEPAKAAAPAPAPAAAPAKPAAQPAKPAAPPAKPAAAADEPDPALVEAAKKEGKGTWDTSLELTTAKKLGEMFAKKYGVPVEVVRDGSEKIFSQFMKEQTTNIKKADVVHTSDASNFLTMRERGLIVPYRPKAADVFVPAVKANTSGEGDYWFALRVSLFSVAYNTNKVKDADAPKAWKDMLDAKWKGKLVHGHPGYSGFVMTGMHLLEQTLGADYYKQLAKNEPLIVQSALDVTGKVVAGEREVGAGTVHYQVFANMAKGNPVKVALPSEGVPLVVSPQALVKSAPHPNAAKLFQEYGVSREAQQFLAEDGGHHSARGDVQLPQGQVDLTKIKLLFADPAAVEKAREGIQKTFKDLFGV